MWVPRIKIRSFVRFGASTFTHWTISPPQNSILFLEAHIPPYWRETYSRRVSGRVTHHSCRACSVYFTRITVDMRPLSFPFVLFRWKLEGRESMNYICYTICYTHIARYVYRSPLFHTGLLSPNRKWYVTLVRLESSAYSPKSPRTEDQTVVKFVLSDATVNRQLSVGVEHCTSSLLRPHSTF